MPAGRHCRMLMFGEYFGQLGRVRSAPHSKAAIESLAEIGLGRIGCSPVRLKNSKTLAQRVFAKVRCSGRFHSGRPYELNGGLLFARTARLRPPHVYESFARVRAGDFATTPETEFFNRIGRHQSIRIGPLLGSANVSDGSTAQIHDSDKPKFVPCTLRYTRQSWRAPSPDLFGVPALAGYARLVFQKRTAG